MPPWRAEPHSRSAAQGAVLLPPQTATKLQSPQTPLPGPQLAASIPGQLHRRPSSASASRTARIAEPDERVGSIHTHPLTSLANGGRHSLAIQVAIFSAG